MFSMLRSPLFLLIACHSLFAAGVVVQFDPSNSATGPFPADSLTVADASQLTGKHINLPKPDCGAQPSICAHLDVINQFDGFNVQPRIVVKFSGSIDTTTLANGISLVAMDDPTGGAAGLQKTGDIVTINQVIYDPATNTAYAKPNDSLDQHRRYLLIVTDAVHDTSGDPVSADPAFAACLQSDGYCNDLAQALTSIPPTATNNNIVAASLFTTMSATAWLESARRQLQSTPVVVHHPDGKYVFDMSTLTNLTVNFDVGSGNFASMSVPISAPGYSTLFGGLGRIAFGTYLSPLLLNAQQTIDPLPTGSDVSLPTPANNVYFHVFLPPVPPPPGGYPVMIFGHGFGDSSVGGSTIVAPVLAQAGFATIAINVVGHGYGPQSNLVLQDNSGNCTTQLLGGRGLDLNGDGKIDATEGCLILTPVAVGLRDCFRQTVIDLMQLVRIIRAGLDVDGDGVPDLDPNRIYYAGESLGSLYGTILEAIEPNVRAAVFNVGGGSVVDIMRWSQSYQGIALSFLSSLTPPLLPPGAPFNDNYPFRDQPVTINAPGSSDTQNFLELAEWMDNQGDPITFAPHLARSPLAGGSPKPVLFQIARADRTMPNPASSDLIRAAGMSGSTWMYRHDLGLAAYPKLLPQDPHPFVVMFLGFGGATMSLPTLPQLAIGIAAQGQIATFLSSDGATISNPNPTVALLLGNTNFFEQPTTLPADLGYSQ